MRNAAVVVGWFRVVAIMAGFNAKKATLYIIYNISNILSFFALNSARRKKKRMFLVFANIVGEGSRLSI